MDEDKLRKLFKDHISEFDVDPSINHEENFMKKLAMRFKKVIIDITPYIIKLIVIAALVWCVSFTVWGMFLNPDRDKRHLRKVDLEHRKIEYIYKAGEEARKMQINDPEIRKQVREELKPLKEEYERLAIELKKDPKNQEIIDAMILIYEKRQAVIDTIRVRTKQ